MAMYPGVHIFETTKLSLASNGMSGLRPLLVGRFLNRDGSPRTLAQGVLAVDDWMSFSDACLTSSLFIVVDESGVPVVSEPPSEGSPPIGAETTTETRRKTRAKKSEPQLAEMPVELTDANINAGVFALRHYFDNGGGPCLLLSYAPEEGLQEIPPTLKEYDEISLLAVIDASSDDDININTHLDAVITNNQQAFLVTRHGDITNQTPASRINKTRTATYAPNLITGYKYSLDDSGILVQLGSDSGTSVVSLAELRTKDKAIYDVVNTALAKVTLPPGAQAPVVLSPCAAVAGAYCRTERQIGIWKAPANVSLVGATPAELIGESLHGELNAAGINAIIWNPKSGTSIMGARTCEDPNKTAWRYVPVRLLFNTVERDLRAMMAPVIFEPNSLSTWQIVRSGIESYLYNLWKKGGLYGTSPSEAYVVNIGLETMSEDDIENGILRVRIGMAALRSTEFIYIDFTQDVYNLASA
ncbi:TPA: phage tail sheath family protein [Serratia odorifera]|nr:phage tail sheath family protein [Serratia odorifera]